MIHTEVYHRLKATCDAAGATLVAVSKTKPVAALQALYDLGHRDFGENYVQELVEKQAVLPADIRWHFIGHLQSNKVKQIIPFVHLIHSVDSPRLLAEINKQAEKIRQPVNCLLQLHIAQEETKYGMDEQEIDQLLTDAASLPYTEVRGLMGMASFTEKQDQVQAEFGRLKTCFDRHFSTESGILSMGMSSDYEPAIRQGSNMIRIGSLLFGARQ